MNPALYTFPACAENEKSGLRHFALNLDLYTHFTSPIRRFPDIIVHQMLMKVPHFNFCNPQTLMENEKFKKDYFNKEDESKNLDLHPLDEVQLSNFCCYANAKKLASRESQAEADMLFFSVFLYLKYGAKGYEVDGLIQSLSEKFMVISVPEFGGVSFNVHYHLMEFDDNACSSVYSSVSSGSSAAATNTTLSNSNSSNLTYLKRTLESFNFSPESTTVEITTSKGPNKAAVTTTSLKMFDLVKCNLFVDKLDLMVEDRVNVRLIL